MSALIRAGWDSVAQVKERLTQVEKIAISAGKLVFIDTPNPCADKVFEALVAQIAAADAEIVKRKRGYPPDRSIPGDQARDTEVGESPARWPAS